MKSMNCNSILITGGEGYIARNIKPLFEKAGYNVFAPSHSELDLLNRESIYNYLDKKYLTAIIHTASKGCKHNVVDTFENTYLPNIQMFENLTSVVEPLHLPLIIFGSGAEFDRRTNINKCNEVDVFNRWPVDPYGLSKNIITRRALSIKNTYILRLFGCFNHDEDNTRFIKSSILNLKQGLPIEIHQNKMMDFFYVDDVYKVIDYVLNNVSPHHINLTYDHKTTIVDVAKIIQNIHKNSTPLKFNNQLTTHHYTGNGNILNSLPIKLIGLSNGIFETCKKLI